MCLYKYHNYVMRIVYIHVYKHVMHIYCVCICMYICVLRILTCVCTVCKSKLMITDKQRAQWGKGQPTFFAYFVKK